MLLIPYKITLQNIIYAVYQASPTSSSMEGTADDGDAGGDGRQSDVCRNSTGKPVIIITYSMSQLYRNTSILTVHNITEYRSKCKLTVKYAPRQKLCELWAWHPYAVNVR